MIAASENPDEDVGAVQNRPNPIAGPAFEASAHHEYIKRRWSGG